MSDIEKGSLYFLIQLLCYHMSFNDIDFPNPNLHEIHTKILVDEMGVHDLDFVSFLYLLQDPCLCLLLSKTHSTLFQFSHCIMSVVVF